jgi:hypothetical protein
MPTAIERSYVDQGYRLPDGLTWHGGRAPGQMGHPGYLRACCRGSRVTWMGRATRGRQAVEATVIA